jgi:hypothetical protein
MLFIQKFYYLSKIEVYNNSFIDKDKFDFTTTKPCFKILLIKQNQKYETLMDPILDKIQPLIKWSNIRDHYLKVLSRTAGNECERSN